MLNLSGCVFAVHEFFNTIDGLNYRYKYRYGVSISEAAGSNNLGHVLISQLMSVQTSLTYVKLLKEGEL